MRDPDTGNSKGFAFINYASFDASDAAIDAMNGQYLCNRAISISYAFKKDAKVSPRRATRHWRRSGSAGGGGDCNCDRQEVEELGVRRGCHSNRAVG